MIPVELRLDDGWVRSLRPHSATNAVVEFQPLLSRTDVEVLLKSIGALLRRDRKEAMTGIGTDFSGRYWAQGWMTPESLKSIAKTFYSVQTLHSPLTSLVVTSKGRERVSRVQLSAAQPLADVTTLPTVAVLDTGVPADHSVLSRYRRGAFVAPNSCGQPLSDHGSFVASRVVFGDIDPTEGSPATNAGACRYYDVLVATSVDEIDNKSVALAIQAVVATAPDVRVFNLSFDTKLPLDQMTFTNKKENLLLVQDLDNLIFRDDILVVVSAGTSPRGVPPITPYPGHYDDPNWQLGAWARSFSSLTCGSFVDKLVPEGLVKNLGWPSPFARVGPGLCESPKPDFSEHGGNASTDWRFASGLGVFGMNAAGLWEDNCGTSFAAPLLARQAAFALKRLQKVCLPGARPYSVTVKAFLALTATGQTLTGAVKTLAERTLGRGRASAERLRRPLVEKAVLLWQGLLEGLEKSLGSRCLFPRTGTIKLNGPSCAWLSPGIPQSTPPLPGCGRLGRYQFS